MRKADLTSRAVAGFVDLLLIIGLARLPDVLGFLSAMGYLLVRDGLFQGRSVGKKLIGLSVTAEDARGGTPAYRESIIRNAPFAAAYILFLIPYAGWVLGQLALGMECLIAVGLRSESPPIGSGGTHISLCCWKPSWIRSGMQGRVTVPRTGSWWAIRKAAASWIASSRPICPRRLSCSTH